MPSGQPERKGRENAISMSEPLGPTSQVLLGQAADLMFQSRISIGDLSGYVVFLRRADSFGHGENLTPQTYELLERINQERHLAGYLPRLELLMLQKARKNRYLESMQDYGDSPQLVTDPESAQSLLRDVRLVVSNFLGRERRPR